MRQSIGGAWILGLVATFVLLFTAFLAVAINYTRAFKVKNEVIDFVEREEGWTDRIKADDEGAMQLVNNYLFKSGYRTTGKCPSGWFGVKDLQTSSYEESLGNNTRYYYCVKKNDGYDSDELQKAYYNLRLFFEFNIPLFGNIFTYAVNGETTQIVYPADCGVFVDTNCSPRSSGGTNSGGENINPIPEASTYTVSFNSNGGSSVNSQTVNAGGTANKPTIPTKSCYEFVEWRMGSSVYNFSSPVNTDIILAAAWKLPSKIPSTAAPITTNFSTSCYQDQAITWGTTSKQWYCLPRSWYTETDCIWTTINGIKACVIVDCTL